MSDKRERSAAWHEASRPLPVDDEPALCPECKQGKQPNCTGWVINENDEVDICATRETP
jgi:hypothetical protein